MSHAITISNEAVEIPVESRQWRVLAESVKGLSHEISGKPCQDSCYYLRPQPDLLVAAIADGAGSATYSEIGASAAALTAVEHLCPHGVAPLLGLCKGELKELLTYGLNAARQRIFEIASASETDVKQLATTLILLVATPELVAALQVGDGAVVIGSRDGELISLTAPQIDEYINVTTFITSSRAMSEAQFNVWRGPVANIAAFSDGIQMLVLKMPEGTPYKPFFTPAFNFVNGVRDEAQAKEEFKEYLESERFRNRTDDDVTLLLARFVE